MVDKLTKEEQKALETTPDLPGRRVTPIPTLMERILEQKKALLTMQENLRLQMNGVANQLFLIDQLLNPEPAAEAPPDTDTPPQPPSDLPGTI